MKLIGRGTEKTGVYVLELLLGVGLCAAVIILTIRQLETSARRTAFFDGIFGQPMDLGRSWRALLGRREPAAEVTEYEPEPEPEPEVIYTPKAPNRGNIRPVLGEEEDPKILPPEIHSFPNISQPPATVFEDFNKRLFVHKSGTFGEWPETTQDDFATTLQAPLGGLIGACKTYLRPAYPVIIDHYGWWRAASINLELDDNYRDVIIGAYMALPPDLRPVVVTSPLPEADRVLTILRYGFEPLHLKQHMLQPHLRRSLDYLFAALIGPRREWLWFSVARMRKAVAAAYAVEEAERAELQAQAVRIKEAERTVLLNRHANRFAALWDMPEEAPRLTHQEDQPTLMPDDQEAADKAATQVKRTPRIVVAEEDTSKPGPAANTADEATKEEEERA